MPLHLLYDLYASLHHTTTVLLTILSSILHANPDTFAASLEDFTQLLDDGLVPFPPFVTSFTQYTFHNSFVHRLVLFREQLPALVADLPDVLATLAAELRDQLTTLAADLPDLLADLARQVAAHEAWGRVWDTAREVVAGMELMDWAFWGAGFIVYDILRVALVVWTCEGGQLGKSLWNMYEEDILVRVSLVPVRIMYGFLEFVGRIVRVPFTVAYGLAKVVPRVVLFPFRIPYLVYRSVVFLGGLVVEVFGQHVLPYFKVDLGNIVDFGYYSNACTSRIVLFYRAVVERVLLACISLQASLRNALDFTSYYNACTSRLVLFYKALVQQAFLTYLSVQTNLRNALEVKYCYNTCTSHITLLHTTLVERLLSYVDTLIYALHYIRYYNKCASPIAVLYRAFVERVLLTCRAVQDGLRSALDFKSHFNVCTSRITFLYTAFVERLLSYLNNLRNALDFSSYYNGLTSRIPLFYRAFVDRLPQPRNLRTTIFKYFFIASPILLSKTFTKSLPSPSQPNLGNTFDFRYYYNTSPTVRLCKTITKRLSPYLSQVTASISQATASISAFDFNAYFHTTPVVLLALVYLAIQFFRAGWHHLRRGHRHGQEQPHVWVSLARSYTAADRMLVRWRPWWTERFSVNWARFIPFSAHRWAMRGVPVFYQEDGVDVGNTHHVGEPPLTTVEKGYLFAGTAAALYLLVAFLALPFGTEPLPLADRDTFPWTSGPFAKIPWPLTSTDYARVDSLQTLVRGASSELEGAKHYAIFFSHARDSSETHLRWTASWGSPTWPGFRPLQGIACQKDLNLLRFGVDMARGLFLDEDTSVGKLKKGFEAAKKACAKLERPGRTRLSRREGELDVMRRTCRRAQKMLDLTRVVALELQQAQDMIDGHECGWKGVEIMSKVNALSGDIQMAFKAFGDVNQEGDWSKGW